MIKIKIRKKIQEAEGDSEPLAGINLDYLKKNNPKKPTDNPKEYYMKLQAMAKAGVDEMFNKRIIDFFESPELKPEYLPQTGKKYFIKWLANSIKDGHTPEKLEDIRYVKDYFEGTNATELPPNFFDAYKKSEEWHEELAKTAGQVKGGYKTNEVVYEGPNGYKIVRMAWDTGPREDVKHDLLLEGDKMGNCVGKLHCRKILKSGESIFSLRDKDNEPHVTMNIFHDEKSPDADKLDDPNDEGDWNDADDDWDWEEQELEESLLNEANYVPHPSDKFDEIKGKQNKLPEEKYEAIIVPWIMETFKPQQYISAEGGFVTKSKFFDISILESMMDEDVTRDNSVALKALASNPRIGEEKVKKLIDKSKNQLVNRKKGDEDPYYAQTVLKAGLANPALSLQYLISMLDEPGIPVDHIIANPSFTKDAAYKILEEKNYTVTTSKDRDMFAQMVHSFFGTDTETLVKLYQNNKKPSKIAMKGFLNTVMASDSFPVEIKLEAFMDGIVINNAIVYAIIFYKKDLPMEFYNKVIQYDKKGANLSNSLLDIVREESTPLEVIHKVVKSYKVTPDKESIFTEILERQDISEELFMKVADPIVDTFVTDSTAFHSAKIALCRNKNAPEEILKKMIMTINRLDLYYFDPLMKNPSVTTEMLKARMAKTKDKKLIATLQGGIKLRQDPEFGREEIKKDEPEAPQALNESKIVKKMLLLAGITKY